MSVAWGDYGEYSTDIFTRESVNIIEKHNTKKPLFLYLAHLAVHSANTYSPLQAPQDAIDKHKYIKDENRRKFSGKVGYVIFENELINPIPNLKIVL